jgi:hypothetical protein
LEVLDFEVLRFAWARLPVRLLAADFRVDLRVEAAEELVLLLLGPFAFPLLVVFPRLVVVRRRPAAAFFIVEVFAASPMCQ